MNKTILVTGGLGYIGSHIVTELLNNDYNVIVIDNIYREKKHIIDRIEKITNKTFKLYKIDITNKEDLDNCFASNKIDIVIHLAALKSISESYEKTLLYYNVNVNGTINVLECMLKYGCNNIMFSSSAVVYGNNCVGATEDIVELNPLNPYGDTKYICEINFKEYSNKYNQLNIFIFRYFNPIGCHPSGIIGEEPVGIPSNIFPYILNVSIGKYPYLTIYGDDYDTIDGTCIRDYIHIMDIVEAHLLVIKKSFTGFNLYNLGTNKGTSIFQLVNTFNSINNININYKIGNKRKGDIPIAYANVDKFINSYNWKPKYTLENMCSDGYKFILNSVNYLN